MDLSFQRIAHVRRDSKGTAWVSYEYRMTPTEPDPTDTTANEAVTEVRRILDGIDREEGEPNGWWETSHGADMGAKKLAELESFIRTLVGGTDRAEETP